MRRILLLAIFLAAGHSGALAADRGRYIGEIIAACGVCHDTPRQGAAGHLAGGWVIREPGFVAVVPNITPDPGTGIGNWTDAQIIAAIRNGIRPDGSQIGVPMPFELYRDMSDADARAVVAWLRAVPPVVNTITARSKYDIAPRALAHPVSRVADPIRGQVAQGRYLATLAHCFECHSPRLAGGGIDWTNAGRGGRVFQGPWGAAVSANLTASKVTGLGSWSDDRIIKALVTGKSADGRTLAPPMAVRAPILARWTPSDLRALIAYLRSLPAAEPGVAPRNVVGPATRSP